MVVQSTFKALSDLTRREILRILKGGRMTVSEINVFFELSQSTISHHLLVLKEAELITEHKEWKYVYYELNTSVLEDTIVWLMDLKNKE